MGDTKKHEDHGTGPALSIWESSQVSQTQTAGKNADGQKAAQATHDQQYDVLLAKVGNATSLAEVLKQYTNLWEPLVAAAARKGLGNAVISEAVKLANVSDHSVMVKDRNKMNSGADSTLDTTAPDPGEKLPFTDTGWNAIVINTKLGQHDRIRGTDNDGERCTFASALAGKIFDGPSATVAWFESVLTRRDNKDGRTGKEQGEDVLRSVIAAIRAGTATYGDLSWAQEALYEVTLPAGQVGTYGNKKQTFYGVDTAGYSISDDLPSTKVGITLWTPAAVVEYADKLAEGERLMCGWVTDVPLHQLLISKEGGKVYLYDAEGKGKHLHELTEVVLQPYFDNGSFDVYLRIDAAKDRKGDATKTAKSVKTAKK